MKKLNTITAMHEPTDEMLVQCAQQGDGTAFNALYDRYLDVVYRRVRYSIPETDVEDVTQEVFIAVVRSLKDFRGDSKFRTWLYTLMSRKIADYYRRRDPADFQVKNSLDDDETDAIAMIPDGTSYASIDNVILIQQALQQLPARYQEVILLRFADDLPFLEIATRLDQSLEATKSLFRRAIAMLQQVLEETYA
jgi:RNA polymerase sigma-70 factor (ECF subfamily)